VIFNDRLSRIFNDTKRAAAELLVHKAVSVIYNNERFVKRRVRTVQGSRRITISRYVRSNKTVLSLLEYVSVINVM